MTPPVVYDTDPCPARGAPDLLHVKGEDGRCEVCHEPCSRTVAEPAAATLPGPRFPYAPDLRVPPPLWPEYRDLRMAGMPDIDAHAIIALRHGLDPAGRPWTLTELVRIEFLRWRWSGDWAR